MGQRAPEGRRGGLRRPRLRKAVVDMIDGTENVDLVAMADLFEDRLEKSIGSLRKNPSVAKAPERLKVDPEHHFRRLRCLQEVCWPAISTSSSWPRPPGYRPAHFEAAIEAKKHVFCEKAVRYGSSGECGASWRRPRRARN